MSHFNPAQPITLDVDGRQVIVRFPTDEQLERLWHSRHYLKTDMGRGKVNKQLCQSNEFDRELLGNPLLAGPKPSLSDIRKILDLLDATETRASREKDALCHVTLTTRFGPPFVLTHYVRFPTSDELIESEHAADAAVTRTARGKHTIVRLSPVWAPHFYNLWAVQQEGYTGAIPLAHQVHAVTALQGFVRKCFSAIRPGGQQQYGPLSNQNSKGTFRGLGTDCAANASVRKQLQ